MLIITHKFREVLAFADEVTVLRRGRLRRWRPCRRLSVAEMAQMMVGDQASREHAGREEREPGAVMLALSRRHGPGRCWRARRCAGVDLAVRRGEIVGVAGVSGNGQRRLVEVLGGQRAA